MVLLVVALAAATPVRAHLATFASEAEARGVDLDVDRVRVRFVRRLETAGFCREDTRPVILLRRSRWKELDHTNQEALLFHELGHCLLDRDHDNRLTSTHEWVSLMRGKALPSGYKAWIHLEGERRVDYLDELFGVEKGARGWAAASFDPELEPCPVEALPEPGSGTVLEGRLQDCDSVQVELRVGNDNRMLAWKADRAPVAALSEEHGALVQVAGTPRPWTNLPLPPGPHTVWMQRQGDRLVIGVDDQAITSVLESELGGPAESWAVVAPDEQGD